MICRRLCLILFSALGITASTSQAQLPNTDLQMVTPAFAKAGTTVEVSVAGTELEELSSLRFSDERIKVAPVTKPADQVFSSPQAVANKFTITIPPGIKPGIVEVRSVGFFGLSTARPFLILPKESTELVEEGDHSSPETAMPLAIETGVGGTIDARKIDYYKITAKKGERLLMQIHAERLDSRADAAIRVYNSGGRELESNQLFFKRDPFVDFTAPADGEYLVAVSDILYRGGSQYFYRLVVSKKPHIDFVWPPAGEPGKKTKFTVYGRNLPGGSRSEGLEISGKALESIQVELDIPADPKAAEQFSGDTPRQAMLPAFEYSVASSNAVRIGFATAPVVIEDAKSDLQKVPFPCEIAGRFNEPGDFDVFRFSAKKDQTYWVESISDRLSVIADSVLIVKKITKDDKGAETKEQVAENDDPPSFFGADRLDSTNLDTNDAILTFTADADADYEVTLINQSGGGSPAHLYRLAIRSPKLDFQLMTSTERNITVTNGRAGYPAAPLVRKGGTMAYRVIAPRQDGFEGDITVRAEGLPPGVSAPPLVLSGKSEEGVLTIKAEANAAEWSGPINIVGRANIKGTDVVHPSRNASLIWGMIFADSMRVRSRLDIETVLSVSGSEKTPAFLSLKENKPLTVELNQKLEIPVKVADIDALRKGNLTVQPFEFPGMLRSPPTVTIAEGKNEGTLTIDFKPNGNFKAEAGKFQFVLQGTGIAKYQHNPALGLSTTAEHKRIEKLMNDSSEKVRLAKIALGTADRESATAKQNADASTAESKAALQKKSEEAAAKAATAKKAVSDAEALVQKANLARQEADKKAKAARGKAVAKDTKFAIFSTPISVEVKAEPEKK